MNKPRMTLTLLLAAQIALPGCVAAVIPLAASGAILNQERKSEPEPEPKSEPDLPVLRKEDRVLTPPGPAYVDIAPPPANTAPPAPNETADPVGAEPPTARVPAATPARSLRAYDALLSYAVTEAARDPVERPRMSAVLQAPTSLSPARADCSIRPPAVLFDLDPADGLFDPDTMDHSDPLLDVMVRRLRAEAIDIFWISGLPALRAGDVRRVLKNSGLDPKSDDGILLIQRSEDRKQERRKQLQETHCLIAIAGDTRSDFDELYEYLKTPELAQPLEELVGSGWFLAPLPLTQGQ
ncbi:hypothetical protein HKD42_12495 [Altererythrobacter sp. RZ02]|uniref:Acid phosphatase n=1 Tax=Pontixanthobacter rizhaonensis TaxID=2730337 RepID=A0A848QJR0_9SPHN|nr:hypothetical protein [Pontixanthobacter rizhaonensis]NMW32882.1 hypothetical protein [Pontixanthobacter rizhaonensis]